MNYTEYLESLEQVDSPYVVEDVPRCPPGYIYDRKKKDCVPKTEKDKLNGRLNDKEHNGGAEYRVWGRTGVNGDGYAFEEPAGRDANALDGGPY